MSMTSIAKKNPLIARGNKNTMSAVFFSVIDSLANLTELKAARSVMATHSPGLSR
jgi:hypothetical protein